MKKIISNILLILICLIIFSGCNENSKKYTDDIDPSKITNVFSKTKIILPDNILIHNFYIQNNTAFIFGYEVVNKDTYERQPVIFSCDLDGKNINKIKTLPVEDGYNISNIYICDDDSYIIIYESYNSSKQDADIIMKKYDNNDNIIFTTNINSMINDNMLYNINAPLSILHLTTDTEGYVYISLHNTIIMINPEGEKQNEYQCNGIVNSLDLSSNNDIIITYISDITFNTEFIYVDTQTKNFKDDKLINLSDSSINDFYYGGGYDIYIGENNNLMGYSFEQEVYVPVINWINSDIIFNNVLDIKAISSEKFILLSINELKNYENDLYILNKIPDDEVTEKIIIRLSYIDNGNNNIPFSVVNFNRQSTKYRIETKEYKINSENFALTNNEFIQDIISGDFGDILMIGSYDVPNIKNYCKKGVFIDLYELIKEDTNFSEDMLFNCIKKPFEINGQLNLLIPGFTISTLVGKTSNLNGKDNWTISEMINYSNNLEKDQILIENSLKLTMLSYLCTAGMQSFINYETLECDFKSKDFVSILEYANKFSDNENQVKRDFTYESLRNNSTILYKANITSILEYYLTKAKFSMEDITLIGYPSNIGNGTIINPTEYYAISSKTKVPEGAWEVLKYFISEKNLYNNDDTMYFFPSNINVFDKYAEEEMSKYYLIDTDANGYSTAYIPFDKTANGIPITVSKDDTNKLKVFLNSLSSNSMTDINILNIILEEANVYFNGGKPVDETAKVIQSRVSIYFSETES